MKNKTTPKIRARLQNMLRVDHAGEHGAVRIYAGQKAVFSRQQNRERVVELIDEMEAQEQEHLQYFNEQLLTHDVRPTALSPLWHLAGFALGAASALGGERVAMAATAAVEAEIDAHYAAQLEELAITDEAPELAKTIAKFRADEEQHRHTALAEGAEDMRGYPIFDKLIRTGCKIAIRLSERI